MTPQELHESIIYLAMQGKLTQQQDDDGLGSELIRRYLNSNYVEPSDVPFDIPKNWTWVTFASVADFRMGKTPARAENKYWASDKPWVSIADMTPYGHISSTKEMVSSLAAKEVFKETISPAGTLIMSFKLTVGRVSILDVDSYHNEAIISIFPKIGVDNVFRDYLYYLLPTISTFGQAKSAIKGLTLNKDSISKLPIPLPPLAEQKRIVEKIESLMPLVDEFEQIWSRLATLDKGLPTSLTRSIIQSAVLGKYSRDYADDSEVANALFLASKEAGYIGKKETVLRDLAVLNDNLPPLPNGWVWCRLGDVVKVYGGKRIPAGRKLSQEKTQHIYIRVSDMKNHTVHMDSLMYVPEDIYPSISRYIIKKEDVYITVAGTIGSVGTIPAVLDGANLTENADRLVFKHIEQSWLVYCLSSDLIQTQIAAFTTKVGQPKLAIKRIEQLLIPFPPLPEQRNIVDKIEGLMSFVTKLDNTGRE